MKNINWRLLSLAETAGYVSTCLRAAGYSVVLVGGACVSIYSENRYQSSDLDFVAYESMAELARALLPIGFIPGEGRHFTNPGSPFIIEFVAPPVALGNETPVTRSAEYATAYGNIILLTPTDCVKDRLAAYIHWHDPQSLEQAILVALQQPVDLTGIKSWAIAENGKEQYEAFLRQLAGRKDKLLK